MKRLLPASTRPDDSYWNPDALRVVRAGVRESGLKKFKVDRVILEKIASFYAMRPSEREYDETTLCERLGISSFLLQRFLEHRLMAKRIQQKLQARLTVRMADVAAVQADKAVTTGNTNAAQFVAMAAAGAFGPAHPVQVNVTNQQLNVTSIEESRELVAKDQDLVSRAKRALHDVNVMISQPAGRTDAPDP